MVNINDFKAYQTEIAKEVFPSTVHFLTLNEVGDPAPHGSGVLVKIDGQHFVFTAAHVLEDYQEKLWIGIGKNEVLQLGGIYLINHYYPREEDTVDVGIIKLSPETVEKLTGEYTFITADEIGLNHQFSGMPEYLALGYPVSRTKFNRYKNSIASTPFIFLTMPAKPEEYPKNECNPEHQVLVHYDKKSVISVNSGAKQHGPDSYGMSGCGFWNTIAKGFISNSKEKKLVAILTDWPNKNYWKGTRIDVFTEIVRQKFGLDIPASNIIKANIK